MTEHRRRQRLAEIRRLATAERPPRHFDPALLPVEDRELELEIAGWRQRATNAAFAQRYYRYGAVGPRGRW